MLRCRFSDPARVKIQSMLAAGMSDQQILDDFVKEVGLVVLMQPPTKGFHMLSWTMPFVGLASFSAICIAVIHKMRQPTEVAVPTGPPANPADVARYEQLIEKELDKL